MDNQISFFNFSIDKIAPKEDLSLDNSRVRLLYYSLILGVFVLSALQINAYYRHLFMFSIANAVMLASVVISLKLLTYRINWRIISHGLLIVFSLINLVDIFVVLQTVNEVTIAFVTLVVLYSFYVMGQGLGLLYSLLNLLPIAVFLILKLNNAFQINVTPEDLDRVANIICLSACIIFIAILHAHFYRALANSDKQLLITKEQQMALNQKYEQALEQAERSYEEKSAFLSTMSHEIRTPLNAVIGMSNLLIMDGPRPDQKENLEVLKFSAGNLLSIVNDVLDFNKIESGKQVFENIRLNLGELMENICKTQNLVAQEKGLTFELQIDEKLRSKELFGDPTRITQVVFNLISNAIKFTHQGNIWVSVTCLEDRYNMITVNFSVKDTGIGIDADKLKAIFEPFTQQSLSTTRQYAGTGLGLAIVKRILETQGLKIQVSSKLDAGSEFSFNMEFPVAVEEARTAKQAAAQTDEQLLAMQNDLQALRVLIAEDNLVNVMLMKKLLSKWKIVPTIAENGERAVELMRYSNFDIVLMDLQMPLMNGFDAAVAIRKMADPQKAKVPIIALTASALSDIKEKVYASGMNEYVSKPFKPSELLEKMRVLTTVVTVA